MIRKEIVEHIKDQIDSFISAPDCRDKYEEEELARYKSWIAYLEKQKEQKPAEWSEEDQRIMQRIQMILEAWDRSYLNVLPSEVPKYIKWLYSLRPQSHWKPSEEQMDALNEAKVHYKDAGNSAMAYILDSIQKQLNNL